MIRNRIPGAVVLVVALAAVPSLAGAQKNAPAPQAPATHTVVKGETLIELARQNYSDWHRWRDIYELNKSEIKDPHWIYPGQVLKMPGSVTSVAVSVSPAPTPQPVAVRPMPDTVQRMAPAPMPAAANPATTPTIFRRPTAKVQTPEAVDEAGPALPTILTGEYVRAPYVQKAQQAAGVGRLIKSAELTSTGAVEDKVLFKAYDDVLIEPPAGAAGKVGERYVVVRMGRELKGQGVVAVPTGIVELTQPAANGAAAVARVVQLFGEMNSGQTLVPFDTTGISTTARPTPITNGKSGSIKWILSSPVVPTTQAYAVIDLTTADGVRPGDEFVVYRPAQPGAHGASPGDPEVAIGRAQAVKVTSYGTTVILTDQREPSINVGAAVRMSAKMP